MRLNINVRMIMKRVVPMLGALSVMLTAPRPTLAITWCHDYVYSVISGGGNSDGLSPNGDPNNPIHPYQEGLRGELRKRNYLQVNGIYFALTGQPSDSSYLRDGDVLIFGEAHSGIVVDEQGNINHFIQMSGANNQGRPYTIYSAQGAYDYVLQTPLLRTGWTLDRIRDFRWGPLQPPPYKTLPIEVWRPDAVQLMTDWTRIWDRKVIPGGFGSPIPTTFGENPIWDPSWALSWMDFNFAGGHTARLFMITYRANTSFRYVIFKDPYTQQVSGWHRAYGLHQLWPENPCFSPAPCQ